MTDAYDCLIETLLWERERWLKLAANLAARDQEKAKQMLDRQAEYIREQATR